LIELDVKHRDSIETVGSRNPENPETRKLLFQGLRVFWVSVPVHPERQRSITT
jgi:hypothetical protein